MSKWVEVVVARTEDGKVSMGYGYWPVPDVWQGDGMVIMAAHITQAMEKWYQHQGGLADDSMCYRPIVRVIKLRGLVECLVAKHWTKYPPDDVKQFTGFGCYHRPELGDDHAK